MIQRAIRKVQSFNIIPYMSSNKKSTTASNRGSYKSQEDEDSQNSSSEYDNEKKLEFYGNIYKMKIITKVHIDKTELIVTGNEQYTTYFIKVETDMGDYHIHKRYSEFRTLKIDLESQYHDLVLNEFPRKKLFSSFKQKTIDERMKTLNEFLSTVYEAYVKKQIWIFLDFIDIQDQFIKKGIHDFFREQANSSVLLRQHPEIINSVPIKPSSEQETKMLEILQKLNAFTDSVTYGFEKLRSFYFKDQPMLSRNFIPLILIGEDKLKGIIELSLQVTKENRDSHLICCQGLKLVLDLMDFQKNPSAQQFIDIYTSTTFQDMKKFNFKAHILNKHAKECKTYAFKLLKTYIDAHSKTLTKVTRQLLVDDKTFDEYIKHFKVQNVPRQLLNQVQRNILDDEQNPEHNQDNDHMSIVQTQDFKERFMFKRNSINDKSSNNFADLRFHVSKQHDICDFDELKEAIDDHTIEWKSVYSVEDSLSFKHCDYPAKYILLSFFLPLSLSEAQTSFVDNRKDWDTLLMENKKINTNQQNEEIWKESLYFQRYSGTRLLSFIYKRKIIEQNDSVYIYKEPSSFSEQKILHNEDQGKWFQCIKLSHYKNEKKIKKFSNTNSDSSATLSLEDEDEEIKSQENNSQIEQTITKIDIITKCIDNNSIIFMSPFLLNDNKKFINNFLNLIKNTSKQSICKSIFDQSLNESHSSTTHKRSDS